jgi:hypothetical protein
MACGGEGLSPGPGGTPNEHGPPPRDDRAVEGRIARVVEWYQREVANAALLSDASDFVLPPTQSTRIGVAM